MVEEQHQFFNLVHVVFEDSLITWTFLSLSGAKFEIRWPLIQQCKI